jgi:hypothetical protein
MVVPCAAVGTEVPAGQLCVEVQRRQVDSEVWPNEYSMGENGTFDELWCEQATPVAEEKVPEGHGTLCTAEGQ